MMDVRPFHVEHLKRLQLQPAQAWCTPHLQGDLLEWLSEIDDAWTAFVDDEPILVGGLCHFWPGRAVVWSYVAASAGPHMVALTRAVERFLDLKAPRRTEAYVDAEFDAGHRWVTLLGFEREGYLKAFTPTGGDQVLYSRVRNG
jgi:hypothetical protein